MHAVKLIMYDRVMCVSECVHVVNTKWDFALKTHHRIPLKSSENSKMNEREEKRVRGENVICAFQFVLVVAW